MFKRGDGPNQRTRKHQKMNLRLRSWSMTRRKKLKTRLSVRCNESATQNLCVKCKRWEESSGLKRDEGRYPTLISQRWLFVLRSFIFSRLFNWTCPSFMINKVDSSIPLTADDTAFLVAALASPILKMPLQPWVQETATSTMDEKTPHSQFHCDQYPTTSISSRSPLTNAVCW